MSSVPAAAFAPDHRMQFAPDWTLSVCAMRTGCGEPEGGFPAAASYEAASILRRQAVSAQSLVVLIKRELAVLDLPNAMQIGMLAVLPGIPAGDCKWRVPRMDDDGPIDGTICAMQFRYRVGRQRAAVATPVDCGIDVESRTGSAGNGGPGCRGLRGRVLPP